MSKFCDVCNSPISLAESHSLIECKDNQIEHLKEELLKHKNRFQRCKRAVLGLLDDSVPNQIISQIVIIYAEENENRND